MDISIIIPSYNRLWSLPKTIESCRGIQCDYEIIVVDDGSTDDTSKWLQTQKDIITLFQPNQGKDWAVNNAFAIAKGKYIKFLDSDDMLPKGAVDQQVAAAKASQADVVVAGFDRVNEEGAVMSRHYDVLTDDFIAQQLGESNSSHYSAFIFKKEFISHIPHRQEYGALDDRMFILEVALHNPSVTYLQSSGLLHLVHNNERLQGHAGLRRACSHLFLWNIYRKVLGRLATDGQLTERRKRAACNILWPLAHWVAYSNLKDACEITEWIYELNPSFSPPDKGVLGKLYRQIGFRKTEQILRIRRLFKYGLWS